MAASIIVPNATHHSDDLFQSQNSAGMFNGRNGIKKLYLLGGIVASLVPLKTPGP